MYESVLAEIHDRWFDAIPNAAIGHIVRLVKSKNKLSILDLGCGSGVLLSQAHDFCSYTCGIDISANMILRAKKRFPNGDFKVGNVLDCELPKVNIITMVGEILSYATIKEVNLSERLLSFFKKVYECLESEGIFLFDVLGNQHQYAGQFFHDHEEWTVFSEVSQTEDYIKRHIVSFLKREDFYSKSVEDHYLRLFCADTLENALREVGFSVKRINMYGDLPLLPGRLGYECKKIT